MFKIFKLKVKGIVFHNPYLMRYHEGLMIHIRDTHIGIRLESGPRHTSAHKVS